MDELEKILEPDEKIYWRVNQSLHVKNLGSKINKVNSMIETGRKTAFRLNIDKYSTLKKRYSDEELLNFQYIDAITDRYFIRRFLLHDASFGLTDEELELLKPFTKFVDDFIKIDLSKLRKITITRNIGYLVELDFNQGTPLDMDTITTLKYHQIKKNIIEIPRIPIIEITFTKKTELMKFLTILKKNLSEKTSHALAKFIDQTLVTILGLIMIPTFVILMFLALIL